MNGNIMELAQVYLETTRPSVLKKQNLNNVVDVMIEIRNRLMIQQRNKKVARNRTNK
jgi:hypothetical protein